MGLWNIFIIGSDVTSVTGAEKACPFHCTTPMQAVTVLFSLMKLKFTIQTHRHLHNSSYAISDVKKVKQSRYRPGVAQRVPGS
jgi:hypothetical protein